LIFTSLQLDVDMCSARSILPLHAQPPSTKVYLYLVRTRIDQRYKNGWSTPSYTIPRYY